MSFYDTLKSLVDKVFMPRRARKGSHRVGDPCRMPFRWGDYLYSNFKTRDCPVNPLLLFYYYILVMISLKHYVYAGSKDKFYCKIIDDNIVYMQKCLIKTFISVTFTFFFCKINNYQLLFLGNTLRHEKYHVVGLLSRSGEWGRMVEKRQFEYG